MIAADTPTGDFGARLRRAREGRGLSLRVIADATKISVRALEALERNDISQLPGGIFSRSFVRAYATEVGLDPEQTIGEFLTRFPHETVTRGIPARASISTRSNARPARWRPTLVWKAVIAGALIAAAIVYLATARRAVPARDGAAPATVVR